MKKKILAVLWVIVVIMASLMGFAIRFNNDNNNKAVVVFSNFEEILQLEKDLGKEKIDIMKEQKKCGITHTAIDTKNLPQNISDIKKSNVKPLLIVKSTDDIENCEKLVKDYNIKYIIFGDDKILGYPNNIDDMSKIINDNNIIFAVKENLSRIGVEDKKGQKELIEKTNYSINRLYKLHEKQLERSNENDLFFKLMRGVIDRNIRFVEIDKIKNPNNSIEVNYEQTNNAALEFSKFIKDMKYTVDKDMEKLDSTKLNINFYILIMIALTITIVRYVKELVKLKWTTILCIGISVMLVFSYLEDFGINVEITLALISSIIFSSLASLSVVKITKTDTKRMMFKGISKFFGICLLGGYVIVSCLNSLEYTMNLSMYRGVKISFIVPILLYIISFIVVYEVKFKDVVMYIKSKSKKALLLNAAVFLLVVGIYILRSGNFKILGASKLELRLREMLESAVGIRPRTKEFLIGYPLIMLFIHFKNSESKLLKFILGFGTAICGVSIVNSFCHVFTAIEISITRSLYGCVFGVFIGGLLIKAWNNPNIRVFLTNNVLVKKIGALYNGSGNTKN